MLAFTAHHAILRSVKQEIVMNPVGPSRLGADIIIDSDHRVQVQRKGTRADRQVEGVLHLMCKAAAQAHTDVPLARHELRVGSDSRCGYREGPQPPSRLLHRCPIVAAP